jgi:transcriptional regulator of arginine metabolism
MRDRDERRTAILGLLSRQPIRSQAELQVRLRRVGHRVNQATLSRDLRDLGVRKGPHGYELPAGERAQGPHGELQHAVAEWLTSVAAALNQLVLKTPPGGAAPLALALDRADLDEVVGTLAGDDTVLVVCANVRAAGRLRRRLAELAPRVGAGAGAAGAGAGASR